MKKPCNHPGCPALVSGRQLYCDKHAHKQTERHKLYDNHRRALDPALAYAAKVRAGSRWKTIRLLKLGEQPTCEDPFGEHERRNTMRSASQVHHIQGLTTHPELAYSWLNLMSVCSQCHARIEQEARAGL